MAGPTEPLIEKAANASTGSEEGNLALKILLGAIVALLTLIVVGIHYHSSSLMAPYMQRQAVLMEQLTTQNQSILVALTSDGMGRRDRPIAELTQKLDSAHRKLDRILEALSGGGGS